jgi:hypothetical protein
MISICAKNCKKADPSPARDAGLPATGKFGMTVGGMDCLRLCSLPSRAAAVLRPSLRADMAGLKPGTYMVGWFPTT